MPVKPPKLPALESREKGKKDKFVRPDGMEWIDCMERASFETKKKRFAS